MAYQFIFHFLVPVYKTTQQVKKGFRDMQGKGNDHRDQKQQASPPETHSQNNTSNKAVGEYIDFEDIK